MAEDVFGIVGSVQGGSYEVQEVVAEGGFAVVYRAHHAAFRAPVALKCLKIPGSLMGAAQAEFLERFREEGELLFRLSAAIPQVVRPLHVGTLEVAGGGFVPFIALEWLEGRTLDRAIVDRAEAGKAPLSLPRAVELLTPVALGLHRAHHFPGPSGEVAILHRDLKPENIFLARVGGVEVPKILDFGIGKVKNAATQIAGRMSSTTPGLSAFTPAYGAPEQWLPKRFGQTGSWTDVWGLALVVVEAALGRPPLEGDDAGALMGQAVDEGRRPTPRAEGLPTTDPVERVFQRALAVDPARRYHEVSEFWRELEAALGMPESEVSRAAAVRPRPAASEPPQAGVSPVGPTLRDLAFTPPAPPPPAAAALGTNPLAPTLKAIEFQPPPPPPPAAARSGPAVSSRASPPTRSPPQALHGVGLSTDVVVRSTPHARVPAASHTPLIVVRRRSLLGRVAGPLKLVALGAAIAVADFILAGVLAEPPSLGPVRAFWIAGPLVIVGIVQIFLRLAADD